MSARLTRPLMMESKAFGFELDGQKDGKAKAGIWRVDADPRRLMEAGLPDRFSRKVEGTGHRLIEGRAVQFVDDDVRTASTGRSCSDDRTGRQLRCLPGRARQRHAHTHRGVAPCRDVTRQACHSVAGTASPTRILSRSAFATPPPPLTGPVRFPAPTRSLLGYSSSSSCSMKPRLVSQSSTTSASLSLVYWAMFEGRMVTVRGLFASVNLT